MELINYLTPTHQDILFALQQDNITVIVDDHKVCDSKKFDGYTITTKDPKNSSGNTELVMCLSTIQQNYVDWELEINRTLAHESIHVAQFCKYRDGYLRPLGFRKNVEDEAYAVQDNPREVLRIVKKYCL